MSRGFASNYRIVLLATGLFACFAGISARLICLHVLDRDELLRNIVKTRKQETRETARRGDILDRSGKAILATSRPMIRVAVDPLLFQEKDEAKLPTLAQLLGMPVDEVRRICTTKYRLSSVATSKAAALAAHTVGAPLLNLTLPAIRSEKDGAPETENEFARQLVTNNDQAPEVLVGADKEEDEDEAGEAKGKRPIRWALLSNQVSESTWTQIEALGLKCLCAPERRFARVYPHNELAAHLVGYANREGRGVDGVELFADFYLRGQDGWREGEKDGKRRELAQFQTREVPRADGYSVRLTIDHAVQDIIERELDKIAKRYQPLKATIIVSRPDTGFILGLANYPTYNPNEYNAIPKAEWSRMKNVAVSDVYEPGSVFKIVAAAAALDEGLVRVESTFNCTTDRITYRGRDLKLPAEDHHFDHPLTVAEIISRSSNRGAAQLAMLLGESKFERYAREFGFGTKLGFPGSQEAIGIFRPSKQWLPIDFTRIPMGQSIAATALQMHQAMATIANGGVLLRPQIVYEIRDTSNMVVYRSTASEIDRVVSRQTAQTMAKLLQGVASPGGTAPGAAIKINGIDYEVAGKTGTAQKYIRSNPADPKSKLIPSKKNHVVSFVGFFPASQPQVAISVIVDDADAHADNGVAYGSSVAAPVFKSIGEKLIPILPITPPNQARRIEIASATAGDRR